MELVLASILCVLVLQDRVFGLPVENGLRPKSPESLTATEFPAVQNEATSNTTEAPAMNHTFVKFDNLQNSEIVPNEAELKLQGYSSMRMLSPSEIDHPAFDPNHFLRVAGIETNEHIEVLPISGKPYFMFIPPEMLKSGSYKDGIFSQKQPHRVKRHHPNLIQNVIGELQNFALVPIKSNNGQIRYILLKNPKFVIGKPQAGQIAPTIVQLGSNSATQSSGGQIRYTPQAILPATKPPFRRTVQLTRKPPVVPAATSLDSIFLRNQEKNSVESSFAKSKTSSKTSKTSLERIVARKGAGTSISTKELTSDGASPCLNSGASLPLDAAEITKKVLADIKSVSNLRAKDNGNPTNINSATSFLPESSVSNTATSLFSDQLPNVEVDKTSVSENTTLSKPASVFLGSTIKDATKDINIDTVVEKAKTDGIDRLAGDSVASGIHLKVKNDSVEGEKVKSSVRKQSKSNKEMISSSADLELTNKEENSTNIDHKNVSSTKIVKDGDRHKIVLTEIVETKVNVENNKTEALNDTAKSDVLKSTGTDTIGGAGNLFEAASVKTADVDTAKAGKQANVLKKTKKTTTITLKSSNDTKSGKPEIAEIEHTVEETVHHNTSETAATESASSANVDVKSSNVGAEVHGNLSMVDKEQENKSATTKQTESTSKSLTKKAVKKTVITKTSDSGGNAVDKNKISGLLDTSPNDGFKTSIEKVEQVIEEISHTSKLTSNKTSSSNAVNSGMTSPEVASSHMTHHAHH